MSTLVAVRVPDELLAKLDARGKRSQVVIAALEAYLNPTASAIREPVAKLVTASNVAEIVRAAAPSIHTGSYNRPAHDASTCTVYKCGMCAAVGKGH